MCIVNSNVLELFFAFVESCSVQKRWAVGPIHGCRWTGIRDVEPLRPRSGYGGDGDDDSNSEQDIIALLLLLLSLAVGTGEVRSKVSK